MAPMQLKPWQRQPDEGGSSAEVLIRQQHEWALHEHTNCFPGKGGQTVPQVAIKAASGSGGWSSKASGSGSASSEASSGRELQDGSEEAHLTMCKLRCLRSAECTAITVRVCPHPRKKHRPRPPFGVQLTPSACSVALTKLSPSSHCRLTPRVCARCVWS